MRLDGKTTLVTAAGAGIGRATALAFAREGAKVIATDIDREALATLSAEHPSISAEHLDVTDKTAIESLQRRFPRLDILMNAVGFVHTGNILECSETDWARSLDANLTGMFRMIRAWLPNMISGGGGSIINIASVLSSVSAMPNRSAYATSKAGVIGLTKSVAIDFASKRVRCNAICPGAMDSPSFAKRLQESGNEAQARAAIENILPMGRVGRPEEVASLAVYLGSDESAYTTGAVHVIDGGWKA